jgi:hypothetical protein
MEAALAALGKWILTAFKAKAVGWLRRNIGRLIGAATVVTIVGVLGLVTMVTAVTASDQGTDEMADQCRSLGYDVDPSIWEPGTTSTEIPAGGLGPGFGPGEVEQYQVASVFVSTAQEIGVPPRAMVMAIAGALQESGLLNIPYGDRDSIGPLQQRPSMGWGTPEQLQDVHFVALSFYGGPTSPHWDPARGKAEPPGLLDIPGWESMPLTQAVQAVQRSGFPDAYAKHEARAQVIVDGLLAGGAQGGTGEQTAPVSPDDYSAMGIDIAAWCDETFEKPTVSSAGGGGGTGSGPGAWGGFNNGRIPLDQLASIPWAPGHLLRPDAAADLIALNEEFKATFGRNIAISDSYRDYDAQVRTKAAKGYLAATPGTSNHGWGLALDLAGGINLFGTRERGWFEQHAPAYGWVSPSWAQEGGKKPEAWHWEYGKE